MSDAVPPHADAMTSVEVSGMSGLAVDLTEPTRDVVVQLHVPAGRTVAVLGPNGAGKSTLLSAIAGLGHVGTGFVRFAGQTWADAHTHRPPQGRDCGYLTQEPLLFPHVNVQGNVAYGLRARHRMRRAPARQAALETLHQVGADAWAHRHVQELSGGQAARVALARALATRPSVMLLDEPFAALDVESADAMRALCADLLRHTTTVIATHDVRDVRQLADDVLVLEQGRVVEHATAATWCDAPGSDFGRRFCAG